MMHGTSITKDGEKKGVAVCLACKACVLSAGNTVHFWHTMLKYY